jgi:hypothetical protein
MEESPRDPETFARLDELVETYAVAQPVGQPRRAGPDRPGTAKTQLGR